MAVLLERSLVELRSAPEGTRSFLVTSWFGQDGSRHAERLGGVIGASVFLAGR